MRIDPDRASEWYAEISGFLERIAGEEDARSPGSLISALCTVLMEAAEAMDESDADRLETVVKLLANQSGYGDVLVFFGRDSHPSKTN